MMHMPSIHAYGRSRVIFAGPKTAVSLGAAAVHVGNVYPKALHLVIIRGRAQLEAVMLAEVSTPIMRYLSDMDIKKTK